MAKDITRVIHGFMPKLQVMTEVLSEKEHIRASIPELAKRAGINYNGLKTSFQGSRVSEATETNLADALSFDTKDPAWVDTSVPESRRSQPEGYDYPGRDKVSDFRYKLRTIHQLPVDYFVQIESCNIDLIDRNLAVLELSDSGQHTAHKEALRLFFSIILEPGLHESGLSYGFCRVRLRLQFDNKSPVKMIKRLGEKREIEIANAKLSVRGKPHLPEWHLAVTDAVLHGEYVTSTDALCELVGGEIGKEFHAELSVRLTDGLLKAPCGSQLPSISKKIIIKQLFSKRLTESSDSQGWLTLGRQALRIVRANNL